MTKSETQKYVCELRTEIASLEENVGYYKDSISRVEKNCDKLYHENKELKQITKGYEDKIAELKKDYKTASELLGKYQQENESLKKRVVELENFSCQAEQETESLVEKLKQHIAELDSKETEKTTKINLNDRIKVKLTPLGAEIYYHQYDDIHKDYPKMKKYLQSSLPKVDENGYTKFQLWHFMELYGEHIGICKPNVINPLDIVVSE